MYLDSAYVAKYYVNEPDAAKVRRLIRQATYVCTSSWAMLEVTCVFHRHVREGLLTVAQGHELINVFKGHVEDDLWNTVPVTTVLLQRTAALARGLPPHVPLRAGDAIHLATAVALDETEIWSNDRHLLGAASHFGIVGRKV